MSPTRLLLVCGFLALPAFAQEDPEPEAPPASPEGDVPSPLDPSRPVPPAVPTGAATGALAPLAEALAGITGDPLFATARLGITVVRARDGAPVWQFGDDAALVAASTTKLLTAATALHHLGPSYRFPTWVMVDGKIDAHGVLDGNLYIKGQGDPSMVSERMWRMLLDIRMHGVREVKGNVYFDDSYFQDSTLIPGWSEEEDLVQGPSYFAPLGALSLNYNIASIMVRAAPAAGQPAAVEFEVPTPAVVLEGNVATGSTRSRFWLDLDREVDKKTQVATFKIRGNIPSDEGPKALYRALADPLGNYIAAFQTFAKGQGIKVKGAFKSGVAPSDATLLLAEYSDPLVDILAQMNKKSNNFMAEQILRVVGAETRGIPGTTEKGLATMGAYLTSLGIPSDGYQLRNGSGLSREGRIRPSTLTTLLTAVYRDPAVGPEFLSSLSVGGRDGTLAYRFREDGMAGRMRGKTGSLDGVTTLAGYVRAEDDEIYAFACLANDIEGAVSRTRRVHERLVLSLAGARADVADGAEVVEDAGR